MGETADAGWVEFSGNDEGGGIGTEVEEELDTSLALYPQSYCKIIETHLSNGEADEFAGCSEMCIVAGDDGKHESADQEALNLNPATTKYLNEENGQEIPRHVTRRSDDQIAISVLEELIVFGFTTGETNRSEKHGLIQVETVKGNIDKEPARCGTNELLHMSPLAKVDHERLQLHILGWRCHVCFDD